MIAVIMVSQPKGNCVVYNLTAAQAEEFIAQVRYGLLDTFLSHTHCYLVII